MSENGDKIELEGKVHRLGSADAMGRGTMLWFNEAKDMGALRTDDGIRIEVPGEAFSDGERPRGRCAGLEIEFQVLTDQISGITFVPVVPARRARIRRRS